jgi:hypothetical protein
MDNGGCSDANYQRKRRADQARQPIRATSLSDQDRPCRRPSTCSRG